MNQSKHRVVTLVAQIVIAVSLILFTLEFRSARQDWHRQACSGDVIASVELARARLESTKGTPEETANRDVIAKLIETLATSQSDC